MDMERIRSLKLSRSDKDRDQRGPRQAGPGHVNQNERGKPFSNQSYPPENDGFEIEPLAA